MINPQQIYTGGAGDGGGFLKCTAIVTESTTQVFECWAASSLATDTGENQSAVPRDNDVIMSGWVIPIQSFMPELWIYLLLVKMFVCLYLIH